jgi:hypothetical protein
MLFADEKPQLSQLTSISASNVRLHAVLEQLSKSTGVDIRCGKSEKDWQSRDIPVIVCVKDMPLDRLLRLIADSTHLAYSVTHTDQDKVICRIYRDKKCQNDLDAEWKTRWDQVTWDWNALIELGKRSDLDNLDIGTDSAKIKAAAKLIASLPPDTLDRLYQEGEIVLNTKTAPDASVVSELYKTIWNDACPYTWLNDPKSEDSKAWVDKLFESAGNAPAPEQIDAAFVSVKVQGKRYQIDISVFPVVKGLAVIRRTMGIEELASNLDRIPGFDLSTRPKTFRSDRLFDISSSKYSFLSSYSKKEEWNLPELNTKFHIDLPKDKKPAYGDIVSAVAKASGFNIVLEDFASYKQKEAPSIASDTTLANALKTLNKWWWSINPDTKTIMGWSTNWRHHHNSLVAEAFINDLDRKVREAGLNLDDVAPLFNLSTDQMYEWFSEGVNTGALVMLYSRDPLWQLYGLLSSKEKTLAKKKTGLLLAEVGAIRLKECYRIIDNDWLDSGFRGTGNQDEVFRVAGDELFKQIAFSDPNFASTLVMKVTPVSVKFHDGLQRYMVELEGKFDQESHSINAILLQGFPITSTMPAAKMFLKEEKETK